MAVLPRTAVVVVHGIGEQRPLSTLLAFVGLGKRAGGLLETEDETHWYVQPDNLSGKTYSRLISYDYQHLIPAETPLPAGVKDVHYARTTHFFEYYWAYRFRDTAWRHLTGLVGRLLAMKHVNVTQPNLHGLQQKRLPWSIAVIALLLVASAAIGFAVGEGPAGRPGSGSMWTFCLIVIATASSLNALLLGGPLGLISTIHITMGIALAGLVGFVAAGYWVLDLSSWHQVLYGAGAAMTGAIALGLAFYAAWLPNRKPSGTDDTSAPAEWPPSLRQRWGVPGVLVVVVATCLVAGSWGELAPAKALLASLKAVVPVAVALLAPLVTGFGLRGVGDAARYLSNSADDVTEREKVRQGLIDLLHGLHEKTDPVTKRPAYERVVLVGHSLGSVIAYDALTAYWAQVNLGVVFPERDQGRESRRAALISPLEAHPYVSQQKDSRVLPYSPVLMADSGARSAWIQGQRRLQTSLASSRRLEFERAVIGHVEVKAKFVPTARRWIVTDLVTLGSPLTYAEVLLADGRDGVEQARQRRLITSNPPATQRTAFKPTGGAERPTWFRYRAWRGTARGYTTKPHHSAVFAATTWTNMYFADDLVGGPLAPYFGMGVHDRIVQSDAIQEERSRTLTGVLTTVTGFLRRFPHTSYWVPAKKVNEAGNTEVVTFLRELARKPRTVVVVSGGLRAAELFRQRLGATEELQPQQLHDPAVPCNCHETLELRYLYRRPANDLEGPRNEWLWLQADNIFPLSSLGALTRAAAECKLKISVARGKLATSTQPDDTADDDAAADQAETTLVSHTQPLREQDDLVDEKIAGGQPSSERETDE